jgi:CBS domain containing-hemolysin-like protein
MGDIPKTGAKYTAEGFLFHVLAADPKRVRRIYIRKLKPELKSIRTHKKGEA